MLWILLAGGGIGACLMFVSAIHEMFDLWGEWENIGRYAIRMGISIVIGLVGLFGLFGINALSYEEVVKTCDWEMVSWKNNSEHSGSDSGVLFYVSESIGTCGCGFYSFYYEENNGGLKRVKVNTGYTIIYEKDDCTPHVVENTTYTKNKMNKILRAILTFECGEPSFKNYEIYTPTGTILRTFSLDAQ